MKYPVGYSSLEHHFHYMVYKVPVMKTHHFIRNDAFKSLYYEMETAKAIIELLNKCMEREEEVRSATTEGIT